MRFTQNFVDTTPKPPKGQRASFSEAIDNAERKGSLQLRVSYGGTKTYTLIRYENGKSKAETLGRHPDLTLKEARRAALHRLNQRRTAKPKDDATLKMVFSDWQIRHLRQNQVRSAGQMNQLLKKHVLPLIGNMKMRELERDSIALVLDATEDTSGPVTADRVLRILNALCNWYAARSSSFANPIIPQMRRDKRPGCEKRRQRWLSEDEIAKLYRVGPKNGNMGLLALLCLYTAQRSRKVAQMRWADIDLSTGIWTIPQGPREKATAKRIRLPKQALDLITQFPVERRLEYVLQTVSGRAYSNFSYDKARIDKRLNFSEPWTLHDLRRTARAIMSKMRVPYEVAELALGHALPGMIRKTYDNADSYQHRIDDALQTIANYIESLGRGDKYTTNLTDLLVIRTDPAARRSVASASR